MMAFYDQLLRFQLFQGLSRAELLQLAGQTKFGFSKMGPGQTVLREGDACRQLYFLVSGQLQLTTRSDDRVYSITEEVCAPWLLQPEALFGATTRHTCEAVTLTDVQFITLSKGEVLRLLSDFLIIRLNLFNILSTLAQRREHRSWRQAPQTLRERIVRFLLDHCTYPAGHKTVRILMDRLAREVNDSRLDVSRVLNEMQREQLLVLHRGRIEIPSLERLFMNSKS